jgi:hypothetical protein
MPIRGTDLKIPAIMADPANPQGCLLKIKAGKFIILSEDKLIVVLIAGALGKNELVSKSQERHRDAHAPTGIIRHIVARFTQRFHSMQLPVLFVMVSAILAS